MKTWTEWSKWYNELPRTTRQKFSEKYLKLQLDRKFQRNFWKPGCFKEDPNYKIKNYGK